MAQASTTIRLRAIQKASSRSNELRRLKESHLNLRKSSKEVRARAIQNCAGEQCCLKRNATAFRTRINVGNERKANPRVQTGSKLDLSGEAELPIGLSRVSCFLGCGIQDTGLRWLIASQYSSQLCFVGNKHIVGKPEIPPTCRAYAMTLDMVSVSMSRRV